MLHAVSGSGVVHSIAIVLTVLLATSVAANTPLPPIDPEADDSGYDWLQIDSGEWLRGEFLRMQDEIVRFDSEEFDEVDLDWEDVEAVVSSGPHTFRIEGRDPIRGTFVMREGRLRIDTGTEVIEVGKVDVLALIPGGGRELDYWSFEASVGLTAQSGNTEQTNLALSADARRESALTRWLTSYRGNFNSTDGDRTAESHRVPTKFDYFLTSRLFLNVATLEWFQDEFQNIQTRFTAGSGVGYQIIDRGRIDWEVSTGAAYQLTRYQSVEAGDDDTEHDVAALFGTVLDFDLPGGIDWDNLYLLQLVTSDLDKTSHHAESTLDFDIWGPLDLEVAFTSSTASSSRGRTRTAIGRSRTTTA